MEQYQWGLLNTLLERVVQKLNIIILQLDKLILSKEEEDRDDSTSN